MRELGAVVIQANMPTTTTGERPQAFMTPCRNMAPARSTELLGGYMEIRLEPKTRAGRNKIANVQFADPDWDGTWAITHTQDSVKFAPGKRGPWYLVEPLCSDDVRRYNVRWVHATDDDNFTVQPNA